jgi:hypothetical protein
MSAIWISSLLFLLLGDLALDTGEALVLGLALLLVDMYLVLPLSTSLRSD